MLRRWSFVSEMLMFGFTQQIRLMGYLNCILYLPVLTIRKEKSTVVTHPQQMNRRAHSPWWKIWCVINSQAYWPFHPSMNYVEVNSCDQFSLLFFKLLEGTSLTIFEYFIIIMRSQVIWVGQNNKLSVIHILWNTKITHAYSVFV